MSSDHRIPNRISLSLCRAALSSTISLIPLALMVSVSFRRSGRDVHLQNCHDTKGTFRGQAMIQCATIQAAKEVIQRCDENEFNGGTLNIKYSQQSEEPLRARRRSPTRSRSPPMRYRPLTDIPIMRLHRMACRRAAAQNRFDGMLRIGRHVGRLRRFGPISGSTCISFLEIRNILKSSARSDRRRYHQAALTVFPSPISTSAVTIARIL
jgi:hypothetical protein